MCIICIFTEENFKEVTYLVNKRKSTAEPIEGQGGWEKCFYSPNSLGEEFIVVCNFAKSTYTPYIRQFAISLADSKGIGLREVKVFGFGKFYL